MRHGKTSYLCGLMGSVICAAIALQTTIRADDAVATADYESDVKPILVRHCYDCHAADTQESGLRLDAAELAILGGDIGAAIVPGDSEASLLIAVVEGTSDDASPMPLDSDPLSPEEIETLKAWIDAGAVYPEDEVVPAATRLQSDHWSFQQLECPIIPDVPLGSRVRNPIDAFILARMSADGLESSPEADRVTLIRRLYLDLLGLLPDPNEVERFLGDTAPDAYEQLVERVLASPHYGERWGRHWLDAARYADSNGFTIDGPRSMWPYRDWVIDAFNRDLPFDQFTIEQLAGDLLAEPTREQRVATGFHRNTLANQEGGTDDEQFRVESVVDRVNTTGTVWMGLTIGCTQCHDHKYDPLTQRDFYRLFAIFNNTADNNDAAGLAPKIELPSVDQTARREQLNTEIASAKGQIQGQEGALEAVFADWEQSLSPVADLEWQPVQPQQSTSTGGAEMTLLEDNSLLVSGEIPAHDVYEIQFRAPVTDISAVQLEVLTHESLPKQGPGLAGNGNFVLTGFELSRLPTAPSDTDAGEQSIPLVSAVVDHAQDGYPIDHAIDGNHETGWAINVKSGSMNVRRVATFFPAEAVPVEQDQTWIIRLKHDSPRNTTYQIGRFRLAVTNAPVESLKIPEEVRVVLGVPEEERSDEQIQQLRAAFFQTDPDWRKLQSSLQALEKQLKDLQATVPTSLVMRELDEPRETFIHIRGNFLRRGAAVAPGVPGVLPELTNEIDTPTRLDLARWLVRPDHPLTARVTVNRVWQRFFGRGLVVTENDFGTQGADPTHPQLLDWLSTELIRQGWSLKNLHRLIVNSHTYRQSSHTRDELQQIDPDNRLLARQSRIRLEAEIVRDACLSAGGLLSRHLHGKPVYPPQPEGIYAFTQNVKPWPESQGEARYRRSLYAYFWRSSPHPMLPTFDAPDANSACTRRMRSNTPLQALTLSNDHGFLEFARSLAMRTLTEGPEYDEGRIRFAFQCSLSREPMPVELERLMRYLDQQRSRMQADPEAAASLVGESGISNIATEDAAAWIALSRVLLNLDEFITRE